MKFDKGDWDWDREDYPWDWNDLWCIFFGVTPLIPED